MQPIPMPEILDPDRIISTNRDSEHLGDPRDHDQQLTDALHASCTYAQQLWHTLDATRHLPARQPPTRHRRTRVAPRRPTRPAGLHDDPAWEQWISAYASITSTLAGPNGDDGYGLDEAHQAVRRRRTAPATATHVSTPTAQPTQSQPVHVTTPARTRPASLSPARRKLRTALTIALTLLALRGLRRC